VNSTIYVGALAELCFVFAAFRKSAARRRGTCAETMIALLTTALLGSNPVAKFETTMGTFTAEIYLDRVPRTASNFIGA
jgi:hypothetical protein